MAAMMQDEFDPQAPMREAALFYGLFLRGQSVDSIRRDIDTKGDIVGLDTFYRDAMEMVTNTKAQTAFDITLEFAKERRAFGRPIGTFQNSRFVFADMRARLDALQTFVDQCVLLYNASELDAVLAAEAKLLSSELEGEVVDRCVQLHGGAGYMAEYRISRMYTDARISRIFAGSSEIMREFQKMLFSKVVPNCKRLGLLTPWVRERFHELDILKFEHEEASV